MTPLSPIDCWDGLQNPPLGTSGTYQKIDGFFFLFFLVLVVFHFAVSYQGLGSPTGHIDCSQYKSLWRHQQRDFEIRRHTLHVNFCNKATLYILVLRKLRLELGMVQTEVISYQHMLLTYSAACQRGVLQTWKTSCCSGKRPVSVQLCALETALINRREGHEEFVCAGRRENVLLASSPDYLTNCCASTRKGRCLLRPHLGQSRLLFSMNA